MLLWKEVIRPGVYCCQDKDGKPFTVPVTSDAIDYLLRTGVEMLNAGLSIPLPLEHQEDAHPLTAAEKAAARVKNNAGWVKKFKKDKSGRLFSLLEIPDADLAKKLPSTIRYVSPHFDSFTDGSGRSWKGVISHLALTLKPRVTQQIPFGAPLPPEIAAAALSLTLSPRRSFTDALKGSFSTSPAKYLKSSPAGWDLANPAYFAEESMADDVATPEGDTAVVPDEPVGGPPKEPGADEDVDLFRLVLDWIEEEYGITFPEDVSEENLPKIFFKLMMDKGGSPDLGGEPGETEPAGGEPIIEESQPMYMSLTEIKKRNDPVVTAMATTILDGASKVRQARIDKLAKRNKALGEKLMKQAEGASLSIAKDGTGVFDPMSATLDALEILDNAKMEMSVNDALRSRIIGSNPVEEPQPQDTALTEEARQKAVKALTKSVPKEIPAAANGAAK